MYTVEEFDEKKTQVMKYVIYKKRTEQEIRNKFNGLIEENFKHVVDYPTGSVYAINKNNGYSLFVLISETDIIYGAYYGEYQDLFGE